MKTTIKSVRDLEVYKLAFAAAMQIFEITKAFPSEERYSLTDQIRRSSRSVCSNLSEGWSFQLVEIPTRRASNSENFNFKN